MVIKIFTIILLILLGILGYLFYQNLPGEPVDLGVIPQDGDTIQLIDYGQTPVFRENLRFDHDIISYYIDDDCSSKRRNSMIEAFGIFEASMQVVSFYELDNLAADILVGCSDDYIKLDEKLFTAGEGGPSRIINTSLFKVIKKGKISLYEYEDCGYPVVELHELSHVFGFDHSPNIKNIMYNTSKCDQRITSDMIKIMKNLYSIESLPELKIDKVSATKKGRYLDFNVTISNNGLKEAKNILLSLFYEGRSFESLKLGNLEVGYGRTLVAENVYMPSRNADIIEFIVDPDNKIEEIDEGNNKKVLKTSPQ